MAWRAGYAGGWRASWWVKQRAKRWMWVDNGWIGVLEGRWKVFQVGVDNGCAGGWVVSWQGSGQMGCGWRKATVSTDHLVPSQDTSHTWEIPGPGALHTRHQS